jgi:hypothetical protein
MKSRDYDERRKEPQPECPAFESRRSGREWLALEEKSSPPTMTMSLCGKTRGDKTAIELFIAGIRGWEAGLLAKTCDGT